MNKILKAHLQVTTATFIISLSFIVSAKLAGIIDPISLTLYRFVLACLALTPVILLIQKYRSKIKQSFKKAMIISLFYSCFFIGQFKALEFTTALNASTLFTLGPLITAVVAIFIFKQNISKLAFFSYLIGIVGTTIVIFKGDIELFLSVSLNYGDIIFLFAVVSMSLYSIFTKYFYKEDDEILTLSYMTLLGGCFWMGLGLLIFDTPLEWQKIQGEMFYYMLYLAIGSTLFTVYLYQKSTVVLGPKKIMAYIYINPAFVAFILFLYEGVVISFWSMVGIVISTVVTLILLREK